VMILQPTSPLRTAADIDAAADLLLTGNADAVISVVREAHPVSWTSPLAEDGVLTDFTPDREEEPDRQRAIARYGQNGAIYLIRRQMLLERRSLYAPRTLAYCMPAERSIDVDEAWDLDVADAVLRARAPQAIQVGSRAIGGRCMVVAEIGVNHNGDPELARQLIATAAEAGADAVKFQTWETDRLVTVDAPLAEYQQRAVTARTQRDMLRALELPVSALRMLKAEADARGVEFFSTADDEASADVLDELGVRLFKIGSAELTNLPLLRHVVNKGKPVVISTGMADLDEVAAAVSACESAGRCPLVLLQCDSAYPSRTEDANIRAMDALRAFGYHVGFSDHTTSVEAALAAVARGASIVEKHITLDRTLSGPDHRASIEPGPFREYVRAIRALEGSLGDGIKQPTAAERVMRTVVRRVAVAARRLRAGEVLTERDIAWRRAPAGLAPSELPGVLGLRLDRDLDAYAPITRDVVSRRHADDER
jgi:N,N'-diacetyllegionaminate synthase